MQLLLYEVYSFLKVFLMWTEVSHLFVLEWIELLEH